MRFLVAESLFKPSRRVVTARHQDAVHLGDLGLLGTSDDQVMAAARSEARVSITVDTDFGGLLAPIHRSGSAGGRGGPMAASNG